VTLAKQSFPIINIVDDMNRKPVVVESLMNECLQAGRVFAMRFKFDENHPTVSDEDAVRHAAVSRADPLESEPTLLSGVETDCAFYDGFAHW
jgi:hypothetical protein